MQESYQLQNNQVRPYQKDIFLRAPAGNNYDGHLFKRRTQQEKQTHHLADTNERKKKQKKITAIAKIAVASSMIDILYKVLTTKQPYQVLSA